MKKILVIEDAPKIRKQLRDIFETEDFEVESAENGEIGVNKAFEFLPDLIVCDIMMPRLDGYEVFKILKKNSITSSIPFIFLSAKTDKSDIRKGMNLGVDDYLPKPFDPDELLNLVQTRINKSKHFKEFVNQKIEDFNNEIVITLPHELRTPLTSILGLSEMLMDNVDDFPSQESIQMISLIIDSGKRLNRIFENYTIYMKLSDLNPKNNNEVFSNGKTKIDNDFVTNILSNIKDINNRIDNISINLETKIIDINEYYLNKVFYELIMNANKFSGKDTPINIFSKNENGKYNIYIQDKGRGMKPEQIANIGAYIQFNRKHFEQQGLGLGLIISKKIIEHYNGNFHISSNENVGTTIEISFNSDS